MSRVLHGGTFVPQSSRLPQLPCMQRFPAPSSFDLCSLKFVPPIWRCGEPAGGRAASARVSVVLGWRREAVQVKVTHRESSSQKEEEKDPLSHQDFPQRPSRQDFACIPFYFYCFFPFGFLARHVPLPKPPTPAGRNGLEDMSGANR